MSFTQSIDSATLGDRLPHNGINVKRDYNLMKLLNGMHSRPHQTTKVNWSSTVINLDLIDLILDCLRIMFTWNRIRIQILWVLHDDDDDDIELVFLFTCNFVFTPCIWWKRLSWKHKMLKSKIKMPVFGYCYRFFFDCMSIYFLFI